MEGRGGCCIAWHAGGEPYATYHHMSGVDRVMLRFRPIAPKPSSGGSVSPPENGADAFAKTGRGKRKYTKNPSKNKKNKQKRSESSTSGSLSRSSGEAETVVTLPLLPDTPVSGKPEDMQVSPGADLCFFNEKVPSPAPVWLRFGDGERVERRRRRRVESWVTVESVTEAWVEGKGLGSTDEERRMNLEWDTCPGFVSDGVGRVRWTNEAYRKMVGQGTTEEEEEVEIIVWLVMKVCMVIYPPAFTCRVRMQYTCRNQTVRSVTVPCDVWRMDGGGFAWRLDVKAALTLCLGVPKP